MNFKIKRIKLLNALAKTTKAVSIRSPLAVLTGVKFDLLSDSLILTGSDSDLTIQTKIESDDDLVIYDEGSVVLNARYILDIVRKIESEYITIEIIDGLLTRIKGSNSEFNLNGINPIEYPRIDLSKTGDHFLISSFTLKEIISNTKFAASDKENRPILTGINLKANSNVIECIATDSYRLAKKIVEIKDDIIFNITVPKNALDEISKIIEKDETIEVYVSKRKVLFVFDNHIIQTRLIDGTYPDTSRLIPDTFEHELDIDSTYLLSAIDRVSLLSNEQNNIIKIEMSDEKVVLSSFIQEIGSVEENLSSSFYKGEPLAISFSSKYVSEALKSFHSSKVKLSFIGDRNPFIINEIDKNDLIQLVLPVRTF